MPFVDNAQMTPRESIEHEWEVDMFNRQSSHAIRIKQLEIAEQKLEAQWSAWFKIPIIILRLPLYVFISLGVMISVALGKEIPQNIIDLIR